MVQSRSVFGRESEAWNNNAEIDATVVRDTEAKVVSRCFDAIILRGYAGSTIIDLTCLRCPRKRLTFFLLQFL